MRSLVYLRHNNVHGGRRGAEGRHIADLCNRLRRFHVSVQIFLFSCDIFLFGIKHNLIFVWFSPPLRASTALTYLSVQSSFLLVVITYGLMPALGSGLAYAAPLVNSMKVNETLLTFIANIAIQMTMQWIASNNGKHLTFWLNPTLLSCRSH